MRSSAGTVTEVAARLPASLLSRRAKSSPTLRRASRCGFGTTQQPGSGSTAPSKCYRGQSGARYRGRARVAARGGLGLSLRGLVKERIRPPFQLADVRAQASTRYQRRWACRRGRTPPPSFRLRHQAASAVRRCSGSSVNSRGSDGACNATTGRSKTETYGNSPLCTFLAIQAKVRGNSALAPFAGVGCDRTANSRKGS